MSNAIPVDVSVIIVNCNTVDLLRQCLRSVYAETQTINCEVIVIDNASADDSVEMVGREFGETKLIANTKNVGFAAANNQGMVAKGATFCCSTARRLFSTARSKRPLHTLTAIQIRRSLDVEY